MIDKEDLLNDKDFYRSFLNFLPNVSRSLRLWVQERTAK